MTNKVTCCIFSSFGTVPLACVERPTPLSCSRLRDLGAASREGCALLWCIAARRCHALSCIVLHCGEQRCALVAHLCSLSRLLWRRCTSLMLSLQLAEPGPLPRPTTMAPPLFPRPHVQGPCILPLSMAPRVVSPEGVATGDGMPYIHTTEMRKPHESAQCNCAPGCFSVCPFAHAHRALASLRSQPRRMHEHRELCTAPCAQTRMHVPHAVATSAHRGQGCGAGSPACSPRSASGLRGSE